MKKKILAILMATLTVGGISAERVWWSTER